MSVLLEKPKKKTTKKAIPLAISSEEKKTQEASIVPAAIAQLLSHSIHGMYLITVGVTVACSVAGFWAAYVLDALSLFELFDCIRLSHRSKSS